MPERTDKYLVSAFMRAHFERTAQPFGRSDWGKSHSLPRNLQQLPMQEKLDLALLAVASKSSEFGRRSECKVREDWPLAQARDEGEFVKMLGYWCDEGALSSVGEDLTSSCIQGYSLTGAGWRKAQELRPTHGKGGNQAFVAMSFSEEMDRAYEEAIEPALRECGWSPFRVDREDFEEKICDKVILEIRRSDLLIVEATGSRPNVYFEAGFAMGLHIPIVWCIKESQLLAGEIAFDTRQHQHLTWDEPEQLRQKLSSRIRAMYPR